MNDAAGSGAAATAETWTIVVAAGSGQRFGGRKQYLGLAGVRVVDRAVRTALAVSDGCVVVVPADADDGEAAVAGATVVRGGSSRAESVRCGLAAVPASATVIVVHDAARPLATVELFGRVCAAVAAGADGAIPGVAVTDTIKLVDVAPDAVTTATVETTPDRHRLVAVQTPQAFAAAVLRAAHAGGGDATDDAALVERAGGRVVVVAGEADNRKLTTADDLVWAAGRLGAMGAT